MAYFANMGTATKFIIGLVALGVIMGLLAVSSYNRLVSLQQGTDAQWANVQNVYQRRADLVPNLVSTVSGAANFEKSTLIAVTEARASVGRVQLPAGGAPTDPAQLAAFEQAQGQLGSALSRLLVVSEQYPDIAPRRQGGGRVPSRAGPGPAQRPPAAPGRSARPPRG